MTSTYKENDKKWIEDIKKLDLEAELRFDVELKDYCTFKIGGRADAFVKPSGVDDMMKLISFCKASGVDYFILGRGSNVLFADAGFRGVVILIADNFADISVEKTSDGAFVEVGAGMLLSKMANVLLKHSLKGFEFASGIPGTLGGAVYMNAGAYGGEIAHFIKSAKVLTADAKIVELFEDELELGYRHSAVMDMGGIILSARFFFENGDESEIKALMQDLNARRKSKQPLEHASAGSTFKRPVGYYAGKLIMDSGLAGFRVGGIAVSDKHCGFVVNDRGGNSVEALELINEVKRVVAEKFGVELECEVRLIGEF